MSDPAMIESISAVTLATHDMARAVRFYRMLGFEVVHGGDAGAFTSFRAGRSYLNLVAQPAERRWSWWGRVIFYHSDVDALHASVVAAGYRPDTAPRDAEWGERFFHLTDPDGHELSFARKRSAPIVNKATDRQPSAHRLRHSPMRSCAPASHPRREERSNSPARSRCALQWLSRGYSRER